MTAADGKVRAKGVENTIPIQAEEGLELIIQAEEALEAT